MVFTGMLDGVPITVSLKPSSFVVSLDDQEIVAWDRAGRLYSVVRGDHTFRRGLNGRLLEKWQEEGAVCRQWPEGARAEAVVERAAAVATLVRDAIDADRLQWRLAPGLQAAELLHALSAGARFDAGHAASDAARFHEVYQPVGMLPPDQYLAVVLQATEGCSFNTCTFCALYDRPYRVRGVGEFGAHVRAVKEYLGDSLVLRGRSIFLGAANALAVPMTRLVPLLEIVGREFDTARSPIHAFVDGFTGAKKTAGDYAALRALGLSRVYVGLESGHDPLLRLVRKPATCADALDTVRAIKAAGVRVGVIVMVGLGGERYAEAHIADTAEALSAMSLDGTDFVYFSTLVGQPGTAYPQVAADVGIRPLTAQELLAQREAIRRRVSYPDEAPRFATYDVREFVY